MQVCKTMKFLNGSTNISNWKLKSCIITKGNHRLMWNNITHQVVVRKLDQNKGWISRMSYFWPVIDSNWVWQSKIWVTDLKLFRVLNFLKSSALQELQCLAYWTVLSYWRGKQYLLLKMSRKLYINTNIVGIINWTEGRIEKPSLAKVQVQTYSSYKSRNTWKKLICITSEICGILDYLNPF